LRRLTFLCAFTAVALALVSRSWAQLNNPILPGNVSASLQPIASGLISPLDLTFAPDATNRLFVADQTGAIRIVSNGVLQSTPFLDVSGRLVSLSAGYDERGLLGMAFDPGFNNPASPGFHTLYTYTSEPVSGAADFTVPLDPGTSFNCQNVVASWTVNPANPNLVDPASRREIMRMDHPQFNHNGGHLTFGPDGFLYVATGDGGNANDVGNGHNATIGNAQDLTNALGKILRIDVHGTNSTNHQYGIPASNPFAGVAGDVKEIFAYGLRNPYSFSFDSATGSLIAGDVGQNNIEEVDRILSGQNYGWHYKEGTFKFNPANGTISSDLSGLPGGLTDPLVEYDHTQGIAVIGGFVYHGSLLPQLDGKYVFGDLTLHSGELFYADLSTGVIQGLPLAPLAGKFLKGFGEDASGEIYVLASSNIGPCGTGGVVYELVPEPAVAIMIAPVLAAAWFFRRRRSD
jgi:glucose/arabinose dehydrogenase